MDNSFSSNKNLKSGKKVKITQRYAVFVYFSISYYIIMAAIIITLVATKIFDPLYLGILISLMLIFGITCWVSASSVLIAIDWNMFVISSDGIKFCGLTRRRFFKWKNIRSCSLKYEREIRSNLNGRKSWVSKRILTFRLTPLEGEIQSMAISYKPKLRPIFRSKNEEEKFLALIQSIIECFAVEPVVNRDTYHWYLQEEDNEEKS